MSGQVSPEPDQSSRFRQPTALRLPLIPGRRHGSSSTSATSDCSIRVFALSPNLGACRQAATRSGSSCPTSFDMSVCVPPLSHALLDGLGRSGSSRQCGMARLSRRGARGKSLLCAGRQNSVQGPPLFCGDHTLPAEPLCTSQCTAHSLKCTTLPSTIAARQSQQHGAGAHFQALPNLWQSLQVAGRRAEGRGWSGPCFSAVQTPLSGQDSHHTHAGTSIGANCSAVQRCSPAITCRRHPAAALRAPAVLPYASLRSPLYWVAGCWPLWSAWHSPRSSPSRCALAPVWMHLPLAGRKQPLHPPAAATPPPLPPAANPGH